MTDLRERVKAALESKRRELIAKPLAQIWDELADAAIAEAFKWMPIETAPDWDDHTKILIIGGRHHPASISNPDGNWWRTEKSFKNSAIPTHWMPLPPPPTEGGK